MLSMAKSNPLFSPGQPVNLETANHPFGPAFPAMVAASSLPSLSRKAFRHRAGPLHNDCAALICRHIIKSPGGRQMAEPAP